jgi:hypothetical protein
LTVINIATLRLRDAGTCGKAKNVMQTWYKCFFPNVSERGARRSGSMPSITT